MKGEKGKKEGIAGERGTRVLSRRQLRRDTRNTGEERRGATEALKPQQAETPKTTRPPLHPTKEKMEGLGRRARGNITRSGSILGEHPSPRTRKTFTGNHKPLSRNRQILYKHRHTTPQPELKVVRKYRTPCDVKKPADRTEVENEERKSNAESRDGWQQPKPPTSFSNKRAC